MIMNGSTPKLSVLWAAGLLAVLAVCLPTFAGMKPTAPTAQFISDQLKAQEAKFGASLEVRYSEEFHQVGGGAKGTSTWFYTRTPEMLRLGRTDEHGNKIVCSYDRVSGESRRMEASGGDCVGSTFTGKDRLFQYRELIETTYCPLQDGPLYQWIRRGNVGPNQELVDGRKCWRVEMPAVKNDALGKYIVWVDAGIGYCPRRLDLLWKREKPTSVTLSDYANAGKGAWYPKRMSIKYFDQGREYRLTSTVDLLQAGRKIPKDEMMVKYPSGTKVIDRGVEHTEP